MLPPPPPPRKRARVGRPPSKAKPVAVAEQPPVEPVVPMPIDVNIDFMLSRRRVAHAHLQHAVQHLQHTLATLSVVAERTLQPTEL
jgi:hypothetical protein